MLQTGILLLLSVEVWNLMNNKNKKRTCYLMICKTTIETPVGSENVPGYMFVHVKSPGNPFILQTINWMIIIIYHEVKEFI